MAIKISAEENRRRVKECMERKGTERLSLYLNRGTLARIKALGFKGSSFVKTLLMQELDRLEGVKLRDDEDGEQQGLSCGGDVGEK